MSRTDLVLSRISYEDEHVLSNFLYPYEDLLILVHVSTKRVDTTVFVSAYDCCFNKLWEERLHDGFHYERVISKAWDERVCIYERRTVRILDIKTRIWTKIDPGRRLVDIFTFKDTFGAVDIMGSIYLWNSELEQLTTFVAAGLYCTFSRGNSTYFTNPEQTSVYEWSGEGMICRFTNKTSGIGLIRFSDKHIFIPRSDRKVWSVLDNKWNMVTTLNVSIDPVGEITTYMDRVYCMHYSGHLSTIDLGNENERVKLGKLVYTIYSFAEFSGMLMGMDVKGVVRLTEPQVWNSRMHKLFSKEKRRRIIEIMMLQSSPTVNGKRNNCIVRKLIRDVMPLICKEVALHERIR